MCLGWFLQNWNDHWWFKLRKMNSGKFLNRKSESKKSPQKLKSLSKFSPRTEWLENRHGVAGSNTGRRPGASTASSSPSASSERRLSSSPPRRTRVPNRRLRRSTLTCGKKFWKLSTDGRTFYDEYRSSNDCLNLKPDRSHRLYSPFLVGYTVRWCSTVDAYWTLL